jgi:hypothetical protein
MHCGFQQKLQNRIQPQIASGGQVRGQTLGGGGQVMQELSADARGLFDNETAIPMTSRTNSFANSNLSFLLIIRVSPFGYEHQFPSRLDCVRVLPREYNRLIEFLNRSLLTVPISRPVYPRNEHTSVPLLAHYLDQVVCLLHLVWSLSWHSV